MADFVFGIGEGIPAGAGGTFGAIGPGIRVLKLASRELMKSFLPTVPVEEAISQSQLGTPVFDQVIIKGGEFFELKDIEKTNPIPYDGILLQTVILEATQSKNIITTAIQGRNGTVKEFISDGDLAVTMTGLLVGETQFNVDPKTGKELDATINQTGNVYPNIDMGRLITICKIPSSIEIISDFLSRFTDSENLDQRYVITDYNFPQREGTRNLQPFQISMLSDVAIDLEEL